MAHDIKNIINTILGNKNSWKIKLLRNWPDIIGNLKNKVRIERIIDETLILGVYDSCLLQELYLLSPVLLKTINEKLENTPIKKLRFKQAGIKKVKKVKSNKIRREIKKTIELTAKENKTLKKIKDPDLKNALKKFLIRCHKEKDL